MKKKILKEAAVLSAMAATCISLTGCGNSKVDKISKYIDNASYEEALSLYGNWNMSAKERAELVEAMRAKLETAVANFAADSIDYDQATAVYSTIHQMYLDELYEDEAVAYSEIQALNSSKQKFAAGTEAMENGDYLYAIECFHQVIELDCNYETAVSNADEALQEYVGAVIARAQEFVKQNDYDSAYNVLTEASAELPDNAEIRDEISALHRQQALEEAEGYAKEGNYEDALATLNEYKETYDANDSNVNSTYEKYADNYVTFIVEKAEKLRSEQKYLQALQMLENASLVVQASEFTDLIAQINEEKPIYLCEVKCQNQDRYELFSTGEELMDTIGNKYAVGNLFVISSADGGWSDDYKGYAEYYLGYKYNSLHGVIAVEDTSDNMDCSITIEGDGVVLYSLDLNRLTVPTPFDIDVSSVNVLTIRSGDVSGDGSFYTILSDFILDK